MTTKFPPEKRVLNPEQKQAVEFGSGPLLIIAGAGTGKTTVVTERIKYLITSGLAKPAEILALTFTEKAAREMEERVDQALPYGYTQMWISTFHSFCDRILRLEAVNIGLNPGYRLLSDTDITMLVRKNLFSFDLNYFRPLGNPTKFIAGMLRHFSRLKDEDVSPNQYFDWVQSQKSKIKSQNEEELLEVRKYEELANVFKQYEDLKVREGLMDFSDLIGNILKLFRERQNILKSYQKQFKYLLVDEFQDTNIAQNELVEMLAGSAKNITAVADDDQAVYKFRGAAVSNVLSFKKHFPKTKMIVLSKNYRSTQEILDKSYRLIQFNNPDRLEIKEGVNKKLASVRGLKGKPIVYYHADRVENEAELVAKEIKRLVSSPSTSLRINSKGEEESELTWKDFAILVRANNHAEPFVRTLSRFGIPYQFLGPGQLFRQPEVKELIAYLQLLANVEDSAAFFKVLSMDYFGISARDLASITAFSRRNMFTLFEGCEISIGSRTMENIRLPFISPETKAKISDLLKMVSRHLGLVNKETAGQILYYFLENTGMLKNILEFKIPLDEKKANNITKFFNKLKNYEAEHEDASVPTVLDWLLLSMEMGESPLAADSDWAETDAVNILTVHSAKGLEFSVVFLVNLVAQRFPTTERREQIPIPEELIKEELPVGDYHLEEERRLFYVGMTRARDLLYMTTANFYGEGKRDKKISPFIVEALGDEIVSKQTSPMTNQLTLLDWQKGETETLLTTESQFKVTYLSYSQIDAFRMCPLHYKLRYLLNISPLPSPALSFGNSIHRTLKEFYQLHNRGEECTKKKLLGLLTHCWIREGYENKQYEREMIARGKTYLADYFDREFNKKTKTILLEQPFTVPITYKERSLKIGGRMDRVDLRSDGKIEIIDYKTGRLPAKREIDANLQLSMYALAATLLTDAPFHKSPDQVVLTLYFFDANERISSLRTQVELEAAKNEIITIAGAIETSDFRCSNTQFCKRCEYKMFCGEHGNL